MPGRSIAAGLGEAGTALAQGFREMKLREDREQAMAKQAQKEATEAKAEFNRLVEMLSDGEKTTRDRLQTMSIAELQGMAQRQELERQAGREAFQEAMLADNMRLRQEAASRDSALFSQQQRRMADTQDFLRLAELSLNTGKSPDEILAAAAGSERYSNADLLTALKYLQEREPRNAEPVFVEDPKTGARFGLFNGSMQPSRAPEVTPSVADFKQFTDPGTGEVLEHVYVDPKGKVVDLRKSEDPRDLLIRQLLGERFGSGGAGSSGSAPAQREPSQSGFSYKNYTVEVE